MAKEICISSTPHETRLAILEDDQLAEIYYERENEYTLAGSVYKGRVTRVLPGMQSAFVDIGLERDAFLYVTDFLEMEDQEDTDEVERAASHGDTVKTSAQTGVLGVGGHAPVAQAAQQAERDGAYGDRQPRSRRSDGQAASGQDIDQSASRFSGQGDSALSNSLPGLSLGSATGSSSGTAAQQDDSDDQGARRWRGRRRRRGGNGRGRDEAQAPSLPVGSSLETAHEEPRDSLRQTRPNEIVLAEGGIDDDFEETQSQAPAWDLDAVASHVGDLPPRSSTVIRAENKTPSATRPTSTPAPFVLPGESLSKYGSASPSASLPSQLVVTALPPDTSDPLPERTVAKPSTLIEDEITWDGKGLFPGESIARHRQPETAQPQSVDPEPKGIFESGAGEFHEHQSMPLASEPVHAGAFEFTEELLATEGQPALEKGQLLTGEPDNSGADSEYDVATHDAAAEGLTQDFSENAEISPAKEQETAVADNPNHPQTDLIGHANSGPGEEEVPNSHGGDDPSEDQPGSSASHNFDPLPPRGFRLSRLFGGRRKEEASEQEPIVDPKPKQDDAKAVSTVSAYSPGEGLVEEEVIDEEEYEFTPIKAGHHGDDHDLEELEEETMQQQIRSGALGEMLQEAHLEAHMGRRIQLDPMEEDESDIEEVEPGGAKSNESAGAPGIRSGGRERSKDRIGGERNNGRTRRGGRNGQSGAGFSATGNVSNESRPDGRDAKRGQSRRSSQLSDLPIISDLLKPGQEILVQIAKEPIAKKGARITSHIALPGRFLVFMPTVSHVGVSRKIASDEERQRLKRVLVSEKGEAQGGFIVRTAAEGATEEELRADLRFLINLWNDIKQRADSSNPPALIYHDLNLIERILRDQVSDNFSHIWVDSEADYERIVRFLNRFSPELVRRVKLYTKEVPLFEHFGIQDEISKALRSKVWLKSGGSIVINQTEALVAIDINTGKFVGKTARLEDTILKTNLDAIPEIVRQIRLRDLGGIIVIDFIDMDERKNRTRVMAALEEALKQDRAPTKVLQFNDFGLVAITRKRVKQSLERTLSVPCPVCQATGMVKSAATVSNEIYVEVRKMRKHFDQPEVLLRVNPETAKALKSNNARWLTELEDLAGKNVLVKSDPTLHPEQFDIQG